MSEFLDILTHGRRLQGAVKELSVKELESVKEKLENIIEKRKDKEREQQKAEQEKRAKIEEIQKQMQEAGLDVDDLQKLSADTGKKTKGAKRPVKYQLKDEQGNTHSWTGIGRMPKVFKQAIDNGKDLQNFSI
ncbi:H-NS histone family protein [Alteromonas halophila]|uniref:DNA-binding protein n=1 Tax=Alteromonas halophila TaxID=516698 RepID=A0A918JQR7_9ALTE|nr:H-NS family nucleoid-associated regulatory protein [Alteromonas halophila]GGW95497.1 DNA-binding protein [Alteromonas halophila]